MNAPNPRMLVVARESRGVSQGQLAAEVGITQAHLSRIESGTREFTDEILNSVVQLLDYPLSFFHEELAGIDVSALAFRKLASCPAKDIKQVIRELEITVRLRLAALLREVALAPSALWQMDPTDFENDPRALAQEARAILGVSDGPIEDLTLLLESHGLVVWGFNAATPKFSGMSSLGERALPPHFVLLSMEMPGDRWRFTLAHELGHLLMQHHLLGDNPDVNHQVLEKEANVFAQELLFPIREARDYPKSISMADLPALKRHYGMSMQAIIMALNDAGVISDRKKVSMYTHLSHMGWRKREPVEIPREKPRLIKEIVKYHIEELHYSEASLSASLHMNRADFEFLFLGKPKVIKTRVPAPNDDFDPPTFSIHTVIDNPVTMRA